MATFNEVLESVEELSLEEKNILVEILQKRLIEQRREQLFNEVTEAIEEYESGKLKPMTVDEIMKEIRS
ncbi:MAG: hypothetical protein A2X61_04780 [Ignavibacteria bacterium GWB2_35_12]|nr:MAG: hypothetical protein A2X63_06090 [Ignavibacteria bacterium GWA2_35_8]OGU37736.1 MAG: hypothetical protein A2X61_04780 [Ignavibacteria bacterium GWB2_35_12]OGU88662.1 MAG: hypothetical protein A2220_00385 [Ignavibacteria bacterium RIFOXYA2_FULL_35_10]OGV23232.1 MAG: hypothetical protein A2475_13335 [Ignavibacteria bacterium RIFOXYC2_FULL_35_21]